MIYCQKLKKISSIVVIAAILLQVNIYLHAQSVDEIINQFHKAKQRYINGQYISSKTRIERVIAIIIEKNVDRKDILGKCYLLLGAIYEKESKPLLAEENYQKAKDIYGIISVDGVNLDALNIYRKIVKGEEPSSQKTIEKEGEKKKKRKKKFPWLLVIGGVIVVGVLVYFLVIKPKKKYRLDVTRGEGVDGSPGTGTYPYKKGTRVSYSYTSRDGYSSLVVRLDGNVVDHSDTVVMNRHHTLIATATANVVDFVTDKDQVEVPEGSTSIFNVKFSAQPREDISMTVNHLEGDNDIGVLAGTNLTFTPSNWDTFQPVTLQAAEDPDTENGEAIFRISATGMENKDITAVEIDNDSLRFITNTDKISIEEGNTNTFKVKLSAAPSSNVAANISKVSGDSDITVRSGSTLTFTPADWDTYQRVTLAASEDPDTENGEATIRIGAPGLQDKNITAEEIDNDTLSFNTDTNKVSIEEGGTNTFRVRLSAAPSSDVTAAVDRVSGDSNITVQSGSPLTFTAANWHAYQAVTLAASEDPDTENGEAIIRISASGLQDKNITAEEIDNDALNFVTDIDEVTIAEGGTATFQVKLSAVPPSDVTATLSRASGDSDISILSGESLTFTTSDWNTFQTVTLQAGEDEDGENGQAIISIEAPGIQTRNITANENDSGTGAPPEVSISRPQDGETVYDDVIIRAVPADDFGIKKVEFYIDDVLKDFDTDFPYRYTWETGEVSIGQHQIKVIAYDAIDQTGEDEITVNVGDSLPSVGLTPPGETPLSGTVKITVTASDYRGVQSIRFYVDNVSLTPWDEGPQTGVNFDYELDSTAYTNGTYTFKAVAVDTAGQESTPAEIEITIEN